MRQLKSFILVGLKLQNGTQANRLQQASSLQAPLDRIRLLLFKTPPTPPGKWESIPCCLTSPHTDAQMHSYRWSKLGTYIYMCERQNATHVNNWYSRWSFRRESSDQHVSLPLDPSKIKQDLLISCYRFKFTFVYELENCSTPSRVLISLQIPHIT